MSTPRILAGRYRVGDLIGHGGMATVRRGWDEKLERDVAIKILDPALARDTAFRTRFRLEAQAASRMSHPSIVRVYDAGEDTSGDAPVPFIVMELVRGTLLKDVIEQRGTIPVEDAVRYTDGILEALDYSHRAGVVHRDIKPGNIMITAAGGVKVMDFGIARAVSDSSATVAQTTQILGTAAYFSPEQAKGEPVDARADLYSTGVVLYEMLTGRQPFRGETPVAVAYQHVSEAPEPPTAVNPQVPGALDPVVLRALAKDPYQRFPDAEAFRETLDSAVHGPTPSKRQLNALTSELYGPSPRQAQETARSLRQLSTDTTMTRTQSGPPVAWIWAGVALIVVLLASVLFWVLSMRDSGDGIVSPTARTVPLLTDMSYERAETELQGLDLIAVRIQKPDADVAEGNVIGTDPEAGTIVPPQTTITVYVSSGAETVAVPTLVGLSLQAATDALAAVGLEVGTVMHRNDPGLVAGTVLETNPAVEEKALPGSRVNLVVASGRVTLLDLTGWSVDAAKAEAERLGLQPNPVADPNCPGSTPPTVTSMSLPPGDVDVRSPLDLFYCAAP